MDVIDRIAGWVAGARAGVGFTGAGISTESGIPDFRSPGGVWTRYDPREFTFQRYVADPEVRRKNWLMRREVVALQAQPNTGHRALARFEELGLFRGVVTQNVDGLHAEAGSTTVEVHGTMRRVVCLSCPYTCSMTDALARVDAGEPDPDCPGCGGILKAATVSFGQSLQPEVVRRAEEWVREADLLLVVGSPLVVYPAAAMPALAQRAGARVVIVNRDPTPYDDIADLVVHGEAGALLGAVLERVERLHTSESG
ncbi:MAG TPA: Sir2 family NAD-dependent protein deacetylase [Actinomycetota bacterium]|nr:Sir2 family NAD-dependent protein deacetylase [Actinomycetota bacterium]